MYWTCPKLLMKTLSNVVKFEHIPSDIYLVKVNNAIAKGMCEMCSKLIIKILASLFLSLNRFQTFLWCFNCWLWTSKCRLWFSMKFTILIQCFFHVTLEYGFVSWRVVINIEMVLFPSFTKKYFFFFQNNHFGMFW